MEEEQNVRHPFAAFVVAISPVVILLAGTPALSDSGRYPSAMYQLAVLLWLPFVATGVLGSLAFAVTRRNPSWLIVTLLTLAFAASTAQVALDHFRAGH